MTAAPHPGPVAPTRTAQVALRPVDSSAIRGGFWFARQETNRAAAIPDGSRQLRTAGNVDNLVNAAKGLPPLRAATRIDPAASGFDSDSPGYRGPLFMDSDVYKWLEAAAWEQDRSASDEFGADSRELIKDVLAAQRTCGYLNSFVQIVTGAPWADLRISHELYCAGHLFQAAVAAHRATGDETLLDVACRFADLLTETFGLGRSHDVDGHPLVEMALVELFRETGERRYLDLAQFAVAARGRSPHDGAYFSDRVAVRAATTLEGHAVRALYLAAGATDVAIETSDEKLLTALEAQWEDVVASKMYLTGGMGARWDGESFGDQFELPTETAYAETCAAIASIQWSWRLLLATGGARYADLIERTLFNGMLAGVSLDGQKFFYANTLQLRRDAVVTTSIDPALGRQRWFSTACCPPNAMRTLAQLQHYVATRDAVGVQLQQYATGTVCAELESGRLVIEVQTDYPHDGTIRVTVLEAPEAAARISMRIPAWAAGARLSAGGEEFEAAAGEYAVVDRAWRAGDVVTLFLPLEARLTSADPRVDAVRGSVAVERGPVVYCLEQVDQPASVSVDTLSLDRERFESAGATERFVPGLLGGTVTLTLPGRSDGAPVDLVAIPYALWANRRLGPMRVWTPDGAPARDGER
ncbi:glycoside hydrolase family 127 protein [Pengzhenrongella sp.]|uniref:glycoside hydrolase family 127 protein n=1 Tax=Pengzhenrongella sp. TaxID=2888820 RepID=UPI002F94165B